MSKILDVKELNVSFNVNKNNIEAVRNSTFTISKGKTLAIVGESGSGKSVTALSILKLLSQNSKTSISGKIIFKNKDILAIPEKKLMDIRGKKISMIFQEPMTSLNPLHTIKKQIIECLENGVNKKKDDLEKKCINLLNLVGIKEAKTRLDDYPHQLSGGQRQRIMIAMAIANNPDILIADEPTTALDVTIQKQILELLDELRKKIGMSLLIISHDLNVVKKISHYVCVMKKGKIVEQGTTKKIFENPSHSYTQSLINCVPKNKTNLDYKKSEVILEAKDISVDYKLKSNFFFDKKSKFSAVKKISFSVRKGETLGIVGESGSGKSSLAQAILNLIDFNGELYFKKQKISDINEASFRSLRKNIQIIFQDPFASLSPRMNIYDIIGEGLTVHKIGSKKNRNKLIHEIINEVGLDVDMLNRYPHEFSGGQRQRIAIARALILKPDLIILDEPTSALDMTVQSQIIDLLLKLQKKEKLTYIFISHDLKVIKALSDNILVMKDGNEIEYGNKKTIFEKPRNTYTKNLIKSAFL